MFGFLAFRRRRRLQAIVDILHEADEPLTTFEIASQLGDPAPVVGDDVADLEREGRIVGQLEDRCMPATATKRPRQYRYIAATRRSVAL